MLNITGKKDGNTLFMALEGRLDSITADQFESEVMSVPDDITAVTLDFAKLEYVSSAGLRVLLGLQQMMEGRGMVKILNPNEMIMEVFEMTGFTDILQIG